MKKINLLIVLLITTFSLYAQISVIPHFGVTGSYYHLSAEGDISKEILKASKSNYSTKLGYFIGVDAVFGINEKIGLKTGLLFQDMGDRTPLTDIELPGATFDQYESTTHYQYLQIPIGIQYTLKTQDKWNFFLDIGGSVMTYMNGFQRSTTYLGSEIVEKEKSELPNDFIRQLNFGARAGFGMNYAISDSLFFRIMANGDIQILSHAKDTIYLPRYYNYGLSVGLGYSL
ncbi:MAG: outer membrane beta-barrel protein [Saprospiraceae bacterium]